MIFIQDLFLRFGDRVLFDDISLSLQDDDKIGVVGRNGAGKSTLLRVIDGSQHVDSGTVTFASGRTVAYMPQEAIMQSTKTVLDEAFTVFEKFTAMEIEAADLEKKLEQEPANAEQLVERYCAIQEELAYFDRITEEQRTHEILKGLGFSDAQKEQVVDTLSVGWKMRVVLAKLLLQKADFYLFDEPTNHLDIIAKEWFMSFLKQAQFGFLLVTHDRYFLQHACEKILELELGHATTYYGPYNFYREQKKERQTVKEAAYNRQQKEIAHKEKIIERFRSKASKAKMAQSMIKQLDRIERIEIDQDVPTMYITFPESVRPGRVMLEMHNVSHSFGGKQLFKDASCEILRGQKVALIAPNGTGKTTLFNLITGKLPLQHGTIKFGHNVQTAFFEQDQTIALDQNSSILEEITRACPTIQDGTVRAFLGSFLFSGDDVHKKIKVLSGGEKNRVAMVKTLLQKANFLLLDEPTNHLDIQSQDLLLQALKKYDGTILIVSHDHLFVQQLADHILELTPNGLFSYPGTYEEYLVDKQAKESADTAAAPAAPHTSKDTQPKKNNDEPNDFELHKKIRHLERQIEKFEQDRDRVSIKLSEQTYGSKEYQKALAQLDYISKELSSHEKELDALLVK
jgi:ATP-binding cassette subfamily F protein 3